MDKKCGKNPFVRIVVLNFNKKDDVLVCLESVFKLSYAPYEVVVVDNGSTDGSPEAVATRFPQAALVRNAENLGASSGRNYGFHYLSGGPNWKYVLILDNDTIVHPDYLSHLVEALEKDLSAGIACGKGYLFPGFETICSAGMSMNRYTGVIRDIGCGEADRGQFEENRYVDGCAGFGVLARKETVDRLNGFDERFNPYGWEEMDFCLRALEAGYKTLYVGNAIIRHKGMQIGRGPVAYYEQSKVKNYFLLLQRHTNIVQKISSFIFTLFRGGSLVLKMLFQGKFSIVAAQFRGLVERFIKKPVRPHV